MPYAWTHIIFGHDVLKKAKTPIKNRKLFQLGCQGPDFFFFYRFWPWLKSENGTTLGNLFHTVECGPVLLKLIQKAKKVTSIREYIQGFITHHILDRNTHPYIHYHAGYKKYKHQRLETILDTLIAKKIKGIKTRTTPLVPYIDVGKNFPKDVVDAIYDVASTTYTEASNAFSKEEYQKAYQDMKTFFSFTFDPCGIKWVLTGGQITPFRFTENIPRRDYLNEERRMWFHSTDPSEGHQSSFWDLWEVALTEGSQIIKKAHHYWLTGNMDDLSELIQNISYDTGKDCSLPAKNVVSNPIV